MMEEIIIFTHVIQMVHSTSPFLFIARVCVCVCVCVCACVCVWADGEQEMSLEEAGEWINQ